MTHPVKGVHNMKNVLVVVQLSWWWCARGSSIFPLTDHYSASFWNFINHWYWDDLMVCTRLYAIWYAWAPWNDCLQMLRNTFLALQQSYLQTDIYLRPWEPWQHIPTDTSRHLEEGSDDLSQWNTAELSLFLLHVGREALHSQRRDFLPKCYPPRERQTSVYLSNQLLCYKQYCNILIKLPVRIPFQALNVENHQRKTTT